MAPVELREHEVSVAQRVLRLLVPGDAEALIDEEAFAHDEFLPYWAELWPAARILAEELAARDLRGVRVVELGCGVGLPSVVAALGGARVLATDWAADAIPLVRENAARNGASLEAERVAWAEPDVLAARGRFDLAVASDVLYEERNVPQLLALLPRLAGEALVVDPGRPALRAFLAGAQRDWEVGTDVPPELPRARIVRLRAPRSRARDRDERRAGAAAPRVVVREPVLAQGGCAKLLHVIRIVIADDHELLRHGLRAALEAEPDLEVVGEASDGGTAVEEVLRLRPDVVLMDVRMPRLDGIEAIRRLRAQGSRARVVVFTTHDVDEVAWDALRAGASGFLLKGAPPEELVEAVRAIADGRSLLAPEVTTRLMERFVRMPLKGGSAQRERFAPLTERELEVLTLVARGLTNREIAERLVLSEATVKTHVQRILLKLELRDRVQAVVLAYEAGLVEPGEATAP